jgi:predicted AlkP superfamily phosphohydrolase/phosphomutase
LRDHEGRLMGTRVYKPERIYEDIVGFPPDLIVLFGNLRWRSVGSVGHPDVYTFEAESGPDDANHAMAGMYILSHPEVPCGRPDATLYDVAPTTLKLLGLKPARRLQGRSLV